MAKKKKEICPYCGKSFAYLSRHKCKIKERVEGTVDEKSEVERRIERIEEKKKNYHRNLRKDERIILNLINQEKDLFFDDLLVLSKKSLDDLEKILEILSLQSKITVQRELKDSSWTKHITSIEDLDVNVEDLNIDQNDNSFIWQNFSYIPCFVCIYENKCDFTNLDQFNPKQCKWLSEWIEANLEGREYIINFADIVDDYRDV